MGLVHSPSIVMDGLVLCLDAANSRSYPGSGTTWTDLSGRGNTGTLTASITYSSNNGGYLAIPNGAQYVSIAANSVSLEYPGDFSMEAWFMVTSQPASGYPSAIFSSWASVPSSADSRFIVFVNSSYQVIGQLKDNSNQLVHQTTVSLDSWNHVALVRASNVFRLYLNTVSSDTTQTSSANLTSALDTWIGNYTLSNSNSMKGRVASYKVYKDKALTAAEVLQNYNALKGRF